MPCYQFKVLCGFVSARLGHRKGQGHPTPPPGRLPIWTHSPALVSSENWALESRWPQTARLRERAAQTQGPHCLPRMQRRMWIDSKKLNSPRWREAGRFPSPLFFSERFPWKTCQYKYFPWLFEMYLFRSQISHSSALGPRSAFPQALQSLAREGPTLTKL